jgi:three-Cys-motif partner protein
MAKRGTDYTELNRRLAFEEDGRPARPVGGWTRDKLALLAYYLPEFAKLCSEKAGGWYYLDGFAGNGANAAPGFPLAKGSALLGATQLPPPTAALLIERGHEDAAILAARVLELGLNAKVLQGNANELIPSNIGHFGVPYLPGFCTLDPEGLELEWSTVEACATHRKRGSAYELLIYFSTPGTARSGGVRAEGYIETNRRRLQRLFGNDDWIDIAELQANKSLPAGDAGKLYLELYKAQLLALGYTAVLDRPSMRQDGNLVYHMVFASANEAGLSIMRSAFDRAYGGQMPFQL